MPKVLEKGYNSRSEQLSEIGRQLRTTSIVRIGCDEDAWLRLDD